MIKEGKTVNDSKASDLRVVSSIDSETVQNVSVSSTKGNSVTKGNKKRKVTRCDVSEAADGKAGKSYATVKKEKKIKKLFGKKQTTTSLSSIPDDDTPALPPKTPERTFGKEGPKPPPTSARMDEKNESKSIEKREDKVGKNAMKVEERKPRMASSPLKNVDENISSLRNKYHTDEGRAQNRARHKYGREEIWAERRPNEKDDDHDEPLYGDERDEKPKTFKKTEREEWEQRKRAFQKRAREESWAEKRPVDDGVADEDDYDIYGDINLYKNDDDDDADDDKAATDENIVDNINNNEANVTKIENDKTRINNWEKVDSNDEDNSEENEADFTTGEGNTHQKEAFEDEQPKEVNEEGHGLTQDNEIQIGIIAHSLDIDEMDYGRERGKENDNHDYDDINDNVDDVDDARIQPLESAEPLNYKPNYFVNSNIQIRADARRKRNKNKNNSDEDGQVNDDEDNSYYDKLCAAFNWDDPFHPSNIRPGLELCPVIVSNKGLGSRWPLRIERYID